MAQKVSFFEGVVSRELANGTVELLRDSEGRAVMANLPDGTRLRWRQMVKDPSCKTKGNIIFSSVNTSFEDDGVLISNLSGYNNAFYISVQECKGDYLYSVITAKHVSGTNNSIQLKIGQNAWGNDSSIIGYVNLSTEGKRFPIFGMANYNGNNISFGYRRFTSGLVMKLMSYSAYNISNMFDLCPSLLPKSESEFDAIFPQGIGYTPYTDDPIECVVCNGHIYKITT